MVPSSSQGSMSLEYFCYEGDNLWLSPDSSIVQLALEDLTRLSLVPSNEVIDSFVVRYAKAYPMYRDGYMRHLKILKDWIAQFPNLYCIGRYGQFRYNNMDHSIMTGFLSVRRMLGETVDPFSVNAEAEYLEGN